MPDKVLIISLIWPEPDSTAAGTHMYQLLNLLKIKFEDITFAATSDFNSYSSAINKLGIKTERIHVNDSSFDSFITKLDPGLVIFDRFMAEEQFGWRVMENCGNCLRVLNTEDLHGLREGRRLSLQNEESLSKHLSNPVMLRELASIWRCDVSLIISRFEIDLLKEELDTPEKQLIYFPFLFEFPDSKRIKALKGFDKRKNCYTIGNFNHVPNVQAIEKLHYDLWPKIKSRLPKARLNIYGAYMPEKWKSRTDPHLDIYYHGYVDNLSDLLSIAKLCLAPLTFGAGLKGKLFESVIHGVPFITTKIGWEGLCSSKKPQELMSLGDIDFIEKTVKLYSDRDSWELALKTESELLREEFDRSFHQKSILNSIVQHMERIDENRSKNFRMKVMTQQTLQASRYLSKYIQAKNQQQ